MNLPVFPTKLRQYQAVNNLNYYKTAIGVMGMSNVFPFLNKWRVKEVCEIHEDQEKIKLESQNKTFDDTVIDVVCASFKITRSEFFSKSRKREVCVFPRQAACMIFREYAKYSYTRIGNLVDRDHSNVIHSLKCTSNSLEMKHPDNLAIGYHKSVEILKELNLIGRY